MLFGNRDSFGIEISLNESSSHVEWVFGHICYWVKAEMVGDLSCYATLRDVCADMKCINAANGKRTISAGFIPTYRDLYLSADIAIYGDEHLEQAEKAGAKSVCLGVPENYEVIPSTESFFKYKCFLFNLEDKSLLVWRKNHGDINWFELQRDEFEGIFLIAFKYLDEECKRRAIQ